ncbi:MULTISPECIES: YiiD C-terminal domain-containing protein [Spongiibacter]|uniref:YiiD C-terminal domain-containing protein n=1 Tax=Spongiibacter TaxID=630749 RepID=UPI0003B624A7|nr:MULTISPECIES: YiiD C-terminal domain-containing protein [Spongiibacter]MAY38205.1 hypothetical protein [Spongiibacter sp.]MBO6754010.1 YiiD C-terminal domain-containing protein [Spongiibacter sp.]MBU72199.1 hypothetical protein [Spongiibacter sp.]|tara:strand:+ start:22018 stop:22485 length:468 start_codon:yes stop_codon:yes gene_type:complete
MNGQQQQRLQAFSQQAITAIPLLQSMDVRFTAFSDYSLRVDMPLAPNINDKNTGFGGSIVALATTAGWAMLQLLMQGLSRDYQVLIVESHIRYLAPVTANCYALASVTESAMCAFYKMLNQRGSGRMTIQTGIEQDGRQLAVFTGTYKVTQRLPG